MDFIELVLLILPAYAANALPVFFSGNTPIDLGNRFADGLRLLGKGKTFRGFVAGVVGGSATGAILALLAPAFLRQYGFPEKLAVAFLLSTGAMIGDIAGSFAKRRIGLAQGEKMIFLDRLTFVLVALFFAIVAFPSLAEQIGFVGFFFLLALTLLVHRLANAVAHHLNLKMVPW